MSKILVGTASWSDKSLVDSGKFYPPTAKSSEDRLKFYAAGADDYHQENRGKNVKSQSR